MTLALPGAQVPLVPLAKGYYGYVLSDRQGHFHRTSTLEGQEYEKEEELLLQPSESAMAQHPTVRHHPATTLRRPYGNRPVGRIGHYR